MSKLRAGEHSARKTRAAIVEAEAQYARSERPTVSPQFVMLRHDEIEVRPVLFQPREFAYGTKETNEQHVKKLALRVRRRGELDPVTVIKLGEAWVCVDGHHRLEAYKAAKWPEPIKCEWFAGDVRQAFDASVGGNDKIKLALEEADKQEAAWRRVLIGGWSKAEEAKATNVSPTTIAFMRRVKKAHGKADDVGERLRAQLGSLEDVSWSRARLTFLHLQEPTKVEQGVAAAKLAKRIRQRMEAALSKDYIVTAMALGIYDPEIVRVIRRAGSDTTVDVNTEDESAAQGLEASKAREELKVREDVPETTLHRELEALLGKARTIKEELARREAMGTRSDLVWKTWTADAAQGSEDPEEPKGL